MGVAASTRSPLTGAHDGRWARERARRPTPARRLTAVTTTAGRADEREDALAPTARRRPGLSRTADGRAFRRPQPAARTPDTDRAGRLGRHAGDHRARRRAALLEPRAARATSSSTRPTTPRTAGRCGATATASAGATTPTRRSSRAASPRRLTQGDPAMVVHPEVGKWLIGAGRAGLRLRAARVALPQRGGRHAHGAGDDPARPAADRLDAARRRRRGAAVLRRPALHAVPARPARHLRRLLPALRRLLPGRRPRLGPAPAGRPRRTDRRSTRDGWGPVRGAALAALAARRRRALRARGRQQVERADPAGRLRAARAGLGHRRPARPRGALAAAQDRGRRRPARLRLPGRWSRSSSTSPPGPGG